MSALLLIRAFLAFLFAPSGQRRVRAWHRVRALSLLRIGKSALRPRRAKVVNITKEVVK